MEIGILVTHGTDTLAWTLPYIRYALKNFPWNVCLTGSQAPMESAFARSDGYQNVHGAVRFLSVLEPPNVFCVFNNGLNAYSDSLAKLERWRLDAFTGDPIATMEWDEIQHRSGDARLREPVCFDELHLLTTGGTIESEAGEDGLTPGVGKVEEFLKLTLSDSFERVYVHRIAQVDSAMLDVSHMEHFARAIFDCGTGRCPSKLQPEELEADSANVTYGRRGELRQSWEDDQQSASLDLAFAQHVPIVYCDPFRSAASYRRQVYDAKAVVLAGYGGGNANADSDLPGSVIPALLDAVAKDCLFVLSSQVPIGPVDFVYETATRLIRRGALSGVDLSLPECQVRLMYLLGHEEQIEGMAERLQIEPLLLKKALFMSGMKFRNRASRRNFRELSGDTFPLIREDLLVGPAFEQCEEALRSAFHVESER